MIENRFDVETAPWIERYKLSNAYNNDTVIVTMSQIKEAFKDNQDELLKIINNKSINWYIEKI
ncbi:hypothetical protein POP12_218 [Pectobacterium phage POP12]|nr:hypothetical protein POP12_218 [Pectobacterium phage POP12]